MGLLGRVFVVNAVVLAAATAVLAFSPLTISFPVALTELVVLALGLAVMLGLNYALLRRALEPLHRLGAGMRAVDPLRPGLRVDPAGAEGELRSLAESFNAMAARLEAERAESSRQLLSTQEAERRRIARELHDEVGQGLTAALLQLDAAGREAPPALAATLAEAREAVRMNLETVREIARRQRPVALEELGLVPALRALAGQLTTRGGPLVQVRAADLPGQLPRDVELALYRVAQEALTNAVRHAAPSEVVVELAASAAAVELRVVDDGAGFRAPDGAGIRGMRERALLAAGELAITPRREGGTEVRLELPLR